jgi:UDP-hydrolysing UDP-N-acetyl-D-glucosamine 2-epimerase
MSVSDNSEARRIGVATSARADYGVYRPILARIAADPALELQLYVTGSHLSSKFGRTVREIEADKFPIVARIDSSCEDDSPRGVGNSAGLAAMGFAEAFATHRPHLLLLLGDRVEMLAAALAAIPCVLPIAHIHGGETTEGAIDDSVRHALTKLAHLHFVAAEPFARRVIAMDEEPWRVQVSGAPGLDNLAQIEILDRTALAGRYELDLTDPFLLVTYHPATREQDRVEERTTALLAAVDELRMPIVFTAPNADAGGLRVRERIEQFCKSRPHAKLFASLGTKGYFSMMAHAAAMIGNSSSGLIEASSFRLPVVNVGDRQQGRLAPANVLHAGDSTEEILRAARRALAQEFRESLRDLVNPYGDGKAAPRIVDRLKAVPLDQRLIRKKSILDERN